MSSCAHDNGPQPLTRRQIRERERATVDHIHGAVAHSEAVGTEELPAMTRREMRQLQAQVKRSAHIGPKLAIAASLGALTIAAPLSGLFSKNIPDAQALPGVSPAPQVTPAVAGYMQAVGEQDAAQEHQAPASIHADPAAVARANTLAASRTLTRAANKCEPVPQGASGLRAALQERSEQAIVRPLAQGVYRHTSPYGMRVHPLFGASLKHEGTDMAAPVGTPIHAVADGVVKHAGNGIQGRSSMLIILEHEINGKKIQTWYVHMYSDGVYVKEGDKVKAGQVIGGVGSFGNSTGPHLHFEVHVGEDMHTIDPLPWLDEVGAANPGDC